MLFVEMSAEFRDSWKFRVPRKKKLGRSEQQPSTGPDARKRKEHEGRGGVQENLGRGGGINEGVEEKGGY